MVAQLKATTMYVFALQALVVSSLVALVLHSNCGLRHNHVINCFGKCSHRCCLKCLYNKAGNPPGDSICKHSQPHAALLFYKHDAKSCASITTGGYTCISNHESWALRLSELPVACVRSLGSGPGTAWSDGGIPQRCLGRIFRGQRVQCLQRCTFVALLLSLSASLLVCFCRLCGASASPPTVCGVGQ